MQHDQRTAAPVHEIPNESHHLELVARVERRHRLVGNQERRFGGQRPGAVHSRAFATGQGRGGTILEVNEVADPERRIHRRGVRSGQPAEDHAVGKASERHHVPHRLGPDERPRLRQIGNPPRPLERREPPNVPAPEKRLPPGGLQETQRGAQQGGLAGPVRADERDELPRGKVEGDVANERTASHGDGDAPHRQVFAHEIGAAGGTGAILAHRPPAAGPRKHHGKRIRPSGRPAPQAPERPAAVRQPGSQVSAVSSRSRAGP